LHSLKELLTSETRNFEPETISGDKFRKGFAFREHFKWLLDREEKRGGAGWSSLVFGSLESWA